MIGGISSLAGFGLATHRATQADLSRTLERLATGRRINRASDDPAGMIAVDRMKAERAMLEGTIKKFERERGWLGTREGALSVVQDLALELQGLVVGAASTGGLGDGELKAKQQEVDSILGAIDRVFATTTFNGQLVFAGRTADSLASTFYNDYDAGTNTTTVRTVGLGALRNGGLIAMIGEDPERAQDMVRGLADSIATERGVIGARLQTVESELRVAGEQLFQITGAQSLIEDTDYAAEISNLIRTQVLSQAQIATMAIGRQTAGSVVTLLENVRSAPAI